MDTEHRPSNKQFECPICNYTSSSETDIGQHIEEKHAFKCKECDNEFLTSAELISHDYEQHRTNNVDSSTLPTTICRKCGHRFSSKSELNTHTTSVHGTSSNKYDCPICNFRSPSEAEVNKHIEENHIFKCKDCPVECSSQEELLTHRSETHEAEVVSIHTCNNCSHEFDNEKDLKQHMSVVHEHKSPQMPLSCDKCGEQFSLENDLESHVQETHVSNSKYKNTLLLGDSNSKYQNPRLIEKALGGKGLFTPGVMYPRTGRAYCSTRDWPNSRYPENNLRDKALEQLSLRDHSFLIFGAPLNDISNIGEIDSQKEKYRLAVQSSENCIKIAEEVLKSFSKLEKVVIHERLPRADYLSDLSEYSNFALRSLAEKSQLSSRIVVVPMDEMHYTTEEEMVDIFGSVFSHNFDGIHPKGRLGGQRYNKCLIAAVRRAGIATSRRRRQAHEEQAIATSNSFNGLN